jgi:biopolymer transport protein TolR
MGMSSLAADDFVAEINVTPFVDVMLVLLIIFMVTAPMMVEGLGVDLPQVRESELLPTEGDHLILTIKDDGSIFLDAHQISNASLSAIIKEQVVQVNKQLFLRADRHVPYGVVVDVMSALRAAGISNLAMVTASETPQRIAAGSEASHPESARP